MVSKLDIFFFQTTCVLGVRGREKVKNGNRHYEEQGKEIENINEKKKEETKKRKKERWKKWEIARGNWLRVVEQKGRSSRDEQEWLVATQMRMDLEGNGPRLGLLYAQLSFLMDYM